MTKALRPRQVEFLRRYCGDGPTRGNATASAIASGYSPAGARVQGHRLVRRLREVETDKVLDVLDLNKHRLLVELAKLTSGRAKGVTPSVQLRAIKLAMKCLEPDGLLPLRVVMPFPSE